MNERSALLQSIDILLVEDNPADVRLTREALQNSKLLNRLTVANDGVEALAILRKQGRYAHAPLSDLILLDLNLPRKNGREDCMCISSTADRRIACGTPWSCALYRAFRCY